MRVGLPPDGAAWIALALAVIAVVAAPLVATRAPPTRRPRTVVLGLAVIAAALSAAYVALYLRGGPRIIDATSYFLEARGFAHGLVTFPLGEPAASTLGRFLVRSPDGARAAVIFPPGFPAVLAIGFLAGAPLAIGPILAACLVVATAELARCIARDAKLGVSRAPPLPLLAATFSAICAALRYHTADTMSHGLAALCVASALALSFRAIDAARSSPRAREGALAALGAGLFAGWLFATRPVSAAALALALALAFAGGRDLGAPRLVRLALFALLGALPGSALFIVHQRAVTGSFGLSSQSLYYALSDGPAGCFRYGFGAHVGCVGEHGDFVRAHLEQGYGALAALGTTARRLFMHLVDAGNAEPFAALVVAGAVVARASRRARVLVAAVVLQIVAYAPFYFDGNYPGGGARFYADVLPVEHVLAAIAVVALASRARRPSARARVVGSAIALVLAGFAFRASFDHDALRDREGGLPMFEPERLAAAGVTKGLVFVDTDHGFDLAFDPARCSPVDVVRRRDDALDRFAWEARGRPPAYAYRYRIGDAGGLARVSIEPMPFTVDAPPSLAVEGESLWPARAQRGAYALPGWASGTCASAARVLQVDRTSDAPGEVELALPASPLAGSQLTPEVALGPGAVARVTLDADGVHASAVVTTDPLDSAPLACRPALTFRVPCSVRSLALTIRCEGPRGATCALDRVIARGGRVIARGDEASRAGECD